MNNLKNKQSYNNLFYTYITMNKKLKNKFSQEGENIYTLSQTIQKN